MNTNIEDFVIASGKMQTAYIAVSKRRLRHCERQHASCSYSSVEAKQSDC